MVIGGRQSIGSIVAAGSGHGDGPCRTKMFRL